MSIDPRTFRTNDDHDEEMVSGHSPFIDPNQSPSNAWHVPFRESDPLNIAAPRWVQAYDDWQEPDGSHDYPWVECQFYDPLTGTTSGSPFEVYFALAWDASNQTKPAPELFSGDFALAGLDWSGLQTITSPVAFSYLGQIINYTGSATDIPDGFALCDASALPANKKIAVANAPDMRGAFLMGIDPADDAGDSSEDTIGDTGGARWHGESENNHVNHDNHRHQLDATTITSATVDDDGGGATEDVMDDDGGAWTSGVDELDPTLGPDLLNHYGSINNSGNRDTDNRPKYYTLAFLIRYK